MYPENDSPEVVTLSDKERRSSVISAHEEEGCLREAVSELLMTHESV
jgi:hypothetical protein